MSASILSLSSDSDGAESVVSIDMNDPEESTAVNQSPASSRLTNAPCVLSWDCGLTNMAYCLIEYVDTPEHEFKVRLWEKFSLCENETTAAVESLVRELDSRPWMVNADHICIEAQMSKNSKMKSISHALQTYFLTRAGEKSRRENPDQATGRFSVKTKPGSPRVHFIAPQHKFKVCSIPEPPKGAPGHARNKRVAIAMAKKMLTKERELTALEYMNSNKKADDLADSLLQGLYFMRKLKTQTHAKRKIQCILTGDGTIALPQNEIIITESADKFQDSSRCPVIYRSEEFIVPKYDVDHASLKKRTVYSRYNV